MNKHTAQSGLPIINDRAAGTDIGSRFHVVAISPGQADDPLRTFKIFTGSPSRIEFSLFQVFLAGPKICCFQPQINQLEKAQFSAFILAKFPPDFAPQKRPFSRPKTAYF